MAEREGSELAKWRRNRRKCLRFLLPEAVFGTVVTAIAVTAHFCGGGSCSVWIWIVGLLIVWHQFIGDLITVICLGRAIARAERERGTG